MSHPSEVAQCSGCDRPELVRELHTCPECDRLCCHECMISGELASSWASLGCAECERTHEDAVAV